MRRMPAGQWVAFEGYDNVHRCNSQPQNPSTGRGSGTATDRNSADDTTDNIFAGLDFVDIQLPPQNDAGANQGGGFHPPGGGQSPPPGSRDVRRASTPLPKGTNKPATGGRYRRPAAPNPRQTPALIYDRTTAQPLQQQTWHPESDRTVPAEFSGSAQAEFPAQTEGQILRSCLASFLALVGIVAVAAILTYFHFHRRDPGESRSPSQGITGADLNASAGQSGLSQNTALQPSSAQQVTAAQMFYEQGVGLTRTGRYAEAVKAYRQAASMNPGFAEAYHEEGYALFRLRKYEDAVAALSRAKALRPKFAETYRVLGQTYEAMGRWAEAARSYGEAASVEPGHAATQFNYAMALKKGGNVAAAVPAMRLAVELKPEWAAAHYELGLMYVESGDREMALKEYYQLASLNKTLAGQLYAKISGQRT
jgi:Flp pilus assembly protein TadD